MVEGRISLREESVLSSWGVIWMRLEDLNSGNV